MDWISILGVLGTIATLIFGVYSIVLAYKRNIIGNLMFIEESFINLQDVLIQNSKSLRIFYENEEIQNETYLLRGFFFSKGKEDITPQMIEKNIQITLPNDNKWLISKVISKSPNLTANLNIFESNLEFDTGLIRYNEFIYFEALIDSKNKKLKSEDLVFDHRIANTTNIIRKNFNNFQNQIFTFAAFVVVAVMAFASFDNPLKIETYNLKPIFYDSKNNLFEIKEKEIQSLRLQLDSYELEKKVFTQYNIIDFVKHHETKIYNIRDGFKVKFVYNFTILEYFTIVNVLLIVLCPIILLYYIYLLYINAEFYKILIREVDKRKSKE